jgi:hypothetical protein
MIGRMCRVASQCDGLKLATLAKQSAWKLVSVSIGLFCHLERLHWCCKKCTIHCSGVRCKKACLGWRAHQAARRIREWMISVTPSQPVENDHSSARGGKKHVERGRAGSTAVLPEGGTDAEQCVLIVL